MIVASVNLDYLASRHSNWAGMIALAIGVAGLMSAVGHYRELGQELWRQEALVSRLQERVKNWPTAPVTEVRDMEQFSRETTRVNAVILELSVPWKELFEAFEASRTNEVALLAIEPDVQKGVVNISAEAKKLENMLDYASSLQKVAPFREVSILNHQIQDQDTEKPVRFVLQATWGIQR